jgi:hypothetical protein
VCRYDEAGNIVYNWDAIDSILNKDAGDITELEYFVLADIYSAMGIDDTTKFLQAVADKVGDVNWGRAETNHEPSSYTEWAYDPNKLANLQKYVDTAAAVLLLQAQQTSPNDDDAWNHFFEQRARLVEKSALLSLMGSLQGLPGAGETNTDQPYSFLEHGALTGISGASGPTLSLSAEGSGYSLTFCNNSTTTQLSPISVTRTTHNHLNENRVNISNTLHPDSVGDSVNAYMGEYNEAKFSYSFSEGAMESAGRLALDHALDEFVYSALPKAVGIVGSIFFAGVDILQDYAEARQNLDDSRSFVNALQNVSYASRLELNAVAITDGTAQVQVLLYPGPQTQSKLDSLNAYIEEQGLTNACGFVYPVTLQNMAENTESISTFFDGLSETERTLALGDTGRQP